MVRKSKRNKLVGVWLTAKEMRGFKEMCKAMKTKPSPQLRKMVLTFAGISDVEVAKGSRKKA